MNFAKYRAINKSKKEWIFGNLVRVEHEYCVVPEDYFRFDGHHISCNSDMPVFCYQNTICRGTGFNDTDKKEIFEKDLVEITLLSGATYRYLIWFMEEGQEMVAVPWNEEDKKQLDFVGYPVNYNIDNINWSDFSFILQDLFGNFKSIKIIGNVINNPEIISENFNNRRFF